MCALRNCAAGAARCSASANASGSSAVASPGISGSRWIKSVSMFESMLCLLDARGYFFWPVRFLAFENAAGDFDQRAGAMQRKSCAPRLWDAGEVFVGERGGGAVRFFDRERV